VPTYHRPAELANCIEAVAQLDYPRSAFELVVVDDGSDTPLEEIAHPWRAAIDIVLLRANHGGPSAARNFGARHARGEYLVFLDDDCHPTRDWLRKIEARVQHCAERLIGGRMVNALDANPYAVASDLLVSHLFRTWNAEPEDAKFLVTANMTVRRQRFLDSGGFDEAFPVPGAEDRAFCARWISEGGRIVFAPEVMVHHRHPMSLRGYWRQHFNYGRGASKLHRRNTSGLPNDGRVESLSFYTDLFTIPTTEGYRRQAPLLTSLLLMAQVASTAGFVSDRIRG